MTADVIEDSFDDMRLNTKFAHICCGCATQIVHAPVLNLCALVHLTLRSGPAGITALPFSEYEGALFLADLFLLTENGKRSVGQIDDVRVSVFRAFFR